jgi:hypothetical protein
MLRTPDFRVCRVALYGIHGARSGAKRSNEVAEPRRARDEPVTNEARTAARRRIPRACERARSPREAALAHDPEFRIVRVAEADRTVSGEAGFASSVVRESQRGGRSAETAAPAPARRRSRSPLDSMIQKLILTPTRNDVGGVRSTASL